MKRRDDDSASPVEGSGCSKGASPLSRGKSLRLYLKLIGLGLVFGLVGCGKSDCELYCEKLSICGRVSPATAEDCRNSCNQKHKPASMECVNSRECPDISNGLCGETPTTF